MPTPAQPPAFSIASTDTQRVEDALALIAPKWTTWTTQTLAQQGHPMRVRDVAARLPFVSEQLVAKRLAAMHADGLVTRVAATATGRRTSSARSASRWHRCTALCRTGPWPTCRSARWPERNGSRTPRGVCIFGIRPP